MRWLIMFLLAATFLYCRASAMLITRSFGAALPQKPNVELSPKGEKEIPTCIETTTIQRWAMYRSGKMVQISKITLMGACK